MFISGGLTIAAPNTPVPLIDPEDDHPGHRITNATIQLPKGQTGHVSVGDEFTVATPLADATGVQLYPGTTESLTVTDLSDVWVSASDAGLRVTYHAKAV